MFFQIHTTEIYALYGFRRLLEEFKREYEQQREGSTVEFRLSDNYENILNDTTYLTISLAPFLQALISFS